jgi:lysozyme
MRTGYKIVIGVLVACGIGYVVKKNFFSRNMTSNGLKFLTSLEGFKNKAYQDIKGLWTIGVGHLIDMNKEQGMIQKVLTSPEVHALLNKDLDRFEKAVNDAIKVPVKPYQKDALYSIAFNIGETGFKNSTLVKAINAGAKQEDIIKAFSKWRTPKALEARRAKEARLYLTGNYSTIISPSDFNKYFKV